MKPSGSDIAFAQYKGTLSESAWFMRTDREIGECE